MLRSRTEVKVHASCQVDRVDRLNACGRFSFAQQDSPLSAMGQYQTRVSKTSESEEPVIRDDNTLLVGETIVDQPLKDEGAPPVFGSPIDSE